MRNAKQIMPDDAAISIAYTMIGKAIPLEQMLKNPAQRAALMARARKHMKQRMQFDLQKRRANDID